MYDMANDVLAPRLAATDDPEIDYTLLKALHFQLFVKCTSHSFSNGTKWGLCRWSSEENIDDLYIAISACISCSSDLFDCLPIFAQMVLYEDPDWTMETFANRTFMWHILVSDPVMVDTIMQVNPRWDAAAGKLRVSTWVRDDPAGKPALLRVLEHFCTWVKFTITRWATVSKAAKRWVGSLLVGLDGWMELCKGDPDVSNYYLNGHWKGKTYDIRSYAVQACFSSTVSEGAGEQLSTLCSVVIGSRGICSE